MRKSLRDTALSLLVLACVPACEEESTYKDFVEPVLKRGLEFGYLYRDMEPSNAGIVVYSKRSQEDAMPRQEISIRLSSVNKGNYPLANAFKVRDIGENTNFAEVKIESRHNASDEGSDNGPEHSPLKVLGGSVSLLDNAPGFGVWNTDGTPIGISVELTVNRKRYSPSKCKTDDNKDKADISVECKCVNSQHETATCLHKGPREASLKQDFETLCCDSLGLFEEQNEPIKFETKANFKASLCTSPTRVRAEEEFCT